MILFSLVLLSCGLEPQEDQKDFIIDLHQTGEGLATLNPGDVGGSRLEAMEYADSLFAPFSLALDNADQDKEAESSKSQSKEQIAQEKPHLLLVFSSTCPYCRKVLDYLASIHKQVPLCNVRENRECVDKLLKQGGKGLVPCLFIDDCPLYDTNTIIAWLQAHQDVLENQQ